MCCECVNKAAPLEFCHVEMGAQITSSFDFLKDLCSTFIFFNVKFACPKSLTQILFKT